VVRRLLSRLVVRPLAALRTRRGALRFACAAAVLALLAPQAWAWHHLRAARAALANHHPEQARPALAACARVWDDRPSVRLLACRAAWQDGDLAAAGAELRAAQRLTGGATDETALEWALVQATAGNVREVEEYLQRRADQEPATGPVVWEALAAGYLRVYRTLDAMACLNHWLAREPNSARALELRGQTYVTGKGVVRGADDFRRALELDPTRRSARAQLAQALVALGGYEEAVGHLEALAREAPDDPHVAAARARCCFFVGRRDEARRLLDDALAAHPDDGLCLRTRGQFALMDDRTADAERWLRRAVAAMPEDHQSHWLLFEALRQQGKAKEAEEQNRRAAAVKDRVARLGELQSRTLAQFPLDPAVHYEMGTLLIQSGHGDVGERWLLTALDLDAAHRPSHAALAAYYERRGDKAKAEFHRARAAPPKE
jgi:tetratricopeptide (TPR) repeat protein